MGAAVGLGAIAGEIGTGPASASAAAAGGVLAVSLTAFGVFVARRAQLMEGFSAVMQRLLFPVLFVSGGPASARRPARLAAGVLGAITLATAGRLKPRGAGLRLRPWPSRSRG